MVKYLLISFILSVFFTGFSMRNQNKNENNINFNTEPMSASINITDDSQNTDTNQISNSSTDSQNANEINNTDSNNQQAESSNETAQKSTPVETTISEFSTKIYDKTPARLNNIRIACSKLNGAIVDPSTSFSFCRTVGSSSEKDGYLKADGLDSEGNTIQVIGGGKCQLSSTLYNAVLKIPELIVTERHTHSKTVPYVKKGKDATVAYDYLDLKFTNNLASSIKIYASSTDKSVSVRLVKIT